MRANLELVGKPLTVKQINDIVWGLGPDDQKFKLRKGTDGEHRWPDAKECVFPQTGGLIRIIGQNKFEELKRRRAQTTDCRSPEELSKESPPRTFQRTKELTEKDVKKEDSVAVGGSAMGRSLAIDPQRERAVSSQAMSAANADCRLWFGADASSYKDDCKRASGSGKRQRGVRPNA